MRMVSEVIPSMLQGMSQQAPELRLATQGELQVNGISHPTFGLGKRNGSFHIRNLGELFNPTKAFSWFITRDERERYLVVYDGVRLRVLGLDGREYYVEATSDALGYLATTDPRRNIHAMTLGDVTLMCNRLKKPAMASTLSAAAVNQALVWVRAGNYSQNYTVRYNATDSTITTSASDPTTIRTDQIASDLASQLDTDQATLDVDYTVGDSHFVFAKNDGTALSPVEVRDSTGGASLKLVNGYAESFADLPPVGVDGMVVKVYGSADDSSDDYWVQYDADRDIDFSGVKRGLWVESIAPATPTTIDPTSMPHKLTRVQDDANGSVTGTALGIYFKFEPITWGGRIVGDTDSSPDPSFIGKSIESMFLVQNRLGFVHSSNVVLSRTADFFNFFRQTITAVLDDDPIDIEVVPGRLRGDQVLNLKYGLPFAEELLLIGDNAQIIVPLTEALTPRNIQAVLSTTFETANEARPLVVDNSVFIPFVTADAVGVRELYLTGTDRSKASTILTTPVPRLMLGKPRNMAVCPSEGTLIVSTSFQSRELYVYRYLNNGSDRVQSSWSVWDFKQSVISFEVLGSELWMLVGRPEGVCLEFVPLSAWSPSFSSPFPVLLDRKVALGSNTSGWDSLHAEGTENNSSAAQFTGESTSSEVANLVPPDGGGGVGGGGTETKDPILPGLSEGGTISGGGTTVEGGEEGGGGGGGGGGTGGGSDDAPTGPQGTESQEDRGTREYDGDDDETIITLPYSPPECFTVVRIDTMQVIPWRQVSGEIGVRLRGDYLDVPLIVGVCYEFRYRFSPAVLQKQTSTGGVGTTNAGRLQVLKWTVRHAESGPFRLEIRRSQRDVESKEFSPHKVGRTPMNVPSRGTAAITVRGRAETSRVDIVNPYFWPSWFVAAEWEGVYTRGS